MLSGATVVMAFTSEHLVSSHISLVAQVVPLRPKCASLCKEQGCGSDEAWALLHHRADDLRGGECLVFTLILTACLSKVWGDQTWPDNWTSVTQDGKLSAQFEQTMVVTDTGVEVRCLPQYLMYSTDSSNHFRC